MKLDSVAARRRWGSTCGLAGLAAAFTLAACSSPRATTKQGWENPTPVEPSGAEGSKVVPPEVAKRLAVLNAKCARAGVGSCIEMGRLSERGEGGVPRSADRAAEAYGLACRQLDAEGCQRLEALLGADDTTPSDLGAVQAHFGAACGRRQSDACVGLATLHAYGLGLPESPARAAEILAAACKAENGVACDRLAQLTRVGVGVKLDVDAAAELEKEACLLGREAACVEVGVRILTITDGERRNFWGESATDHALGYFRTACSKGEYAGCVEFARATIEGKGIRKNVQVGLDLLRSSCTDGYGRACQALGDLAREGVGGEPAGPGAVAWWTKACQLRVGDACALAGEALLHDRPGADARPRVEFESESGRSYLERACQLHSPGGCRRLSQLLQRRAADAKRAASYADLACRYGSEEGCPQGRAARVLRGH